MRDELTFAAQRIRDSVSALDTGQAMGLEIRHGRCRCPLHGGQDYNCVLYRGNRGFYCHVCKQGGDVIKLVREYYGMPFKDAVTWFNDTFRLGMDIDSPMDPDALRKAKDAQRKRRARAETETWLDKMRYERYLTAGDMLRWLEIRTEQLAPDRFGKTADVIPTVRDLIDEYAMECMRKEK